MNGGVYVPVIYDRRLKCRFKKSSQAGASFQAVTDTLTLRVQAALSPLFSLPPPPLPPLLSTLSLSFRKSFRGAAWFFVLESEFGARPGVTGQRSGVLGKGGGGGKERVGES